MIRNQIFQIEAIMGCSIEPTIEKSHLPTQNENQTNSNDAQINSPQLDRSELSKAERVQKWIEDPNRSLVDPDTSANLFDTSTDDGQCSGSNKVLKLIPPVENETD